MCICQSFQLLFPGSLWSSFMRRRFPLDRVRSGRSELLITCLFPLPPPRLPPAWTVFYKRNTPPAWNLLAWHQKKQQFQWDMLLYKNVSCHGDIIVTLKLSTRQTKKKRKITFFFSCDGCDCTRGATRWGMMAWPAVNRPFVLSHTRDNGTIRPDNLSWWLQRVICSHAGLVGNRGNVCERSNSWAQEHKSKSFSTIFELCFNRIESLVR